VLSVVFSPVAANLAARFDARYLIFFGVMWLGLDLFWRSAANTDMTYWQICVPLFFMGVGMPMFYVPLTGVAMASVNEEETAAASGLMNFVRTISGAIATSLVNTVWEDKSKHFHAECSTRPASWRTASRSWASTARARVPWSTRSSTARA